MIRLEAMDTATRNRRLYEHLKELGLFVAVTSDPDDRSLIDSITVSAGRPKVCLVPFDVCLPLEGAKVREVIRPTRRDGDNVVDFPPKL